MFHDLYTRYIVLERSCGSKKLYNIVLWIERTENSHYLFLLWHTMSKHGKKTKIIKNYLVANAHSFSYKRKYNKNETAEEKAKENKYRSNISTRMNNKRDSVY